MYYNLLISILKQNSNFTGEFDPLRELTLNTIIDSGTSINAFFTKHMFGPSIIRAKRLAFDDLMECVATSGILQTQTFILPEVYLEMVDSIFKLTYLCLYRSFLDTQGLNEGLTHGKLVGLCGYLSVPARIYDLAIHTLSPVVMSNNLFIPSPELVRCNHYPNLEEETFTFFSSIGPTFPLANRFGIPLRVGFALVMKSLPGAMISLTPLQTHEVYPVLRNFCFLELPEEFDFEAEDRINLTLEHNPRGPAAQLLWTAREAPRNAQRNELTDVTAYRLRHTEIKNMCYPPTSLDDLGDDAFISDQQWFVPHVYWRMRTEYDFSVNLAAYLPLVVTTDDDLNMSGIRPVTLISDVARQGSYQAAVTNAVRSDFWAHAMHSLKDLRTKEGRILPRFETWSQIRGSLIQQIRKFWKSISFPSLDDVNTFQQPSWLIPSDAPFFPYTIRWTRSVRNAVNVGKPKKVTQRSKVRSTVRENVHETKDVSVPEKAETEAFLTGHADE